MNKFKGCLFVGKIGLFKVYCDFLVFCIIEVREIKQGDIATVSDVKSTESGELVYEIDGEYYYHYYFVLYP